MKDMQFDITNKDGKKTTCYVIATYHDNDSNKDFIIYTDKSYDMNKKLNVYYSLYKMHNNKIELISITETNDKKIALELVRELVKDIRGLEEAI